MEGGRVREKVVVDKNEGEPRIENLGSQDKGRMR
jgi:hypothetical protein